MVFWHDNFAPTPDKWFEQELEVIDPALRVIWGYERYLVHEWAIERKLSSEQYHRRYVSLLESGSPRFIQQPIIENGEVIGERRYDLAPEYEWIRFTPTLDQRVLTALRREYAWNLKHPLTRQRIEKEEREAKEAAAKAKRIASAVDEIDRVDFETGRRKRFGWQKSNTPEDRGKLES